MKELLYKQIRLVAHPMTFAFILCGAMVLIPSYPYTVSFFYVTLGIFFMYQNAREQRDNDYSALLPIRKRDTVKAGVMFVSLVEAVSIAVTSAFVILSNVIAPCRDNLAGIDANPTLLGFGFICYGVFNLIFLTSFYKTGYKTGTSFLKASIGVFLLVSVDVVLPHIVPSADGYNKKQYAVLAVGAAVFILSTLLSYKISAERYEKVDL